MRATSANLVLALLALSACVGHPLRSKLDAALAELVADPALVGGRVGVSVVDTADGEVLARANAGLGFAPASNQKLITAAAALATLGPDHTLHTELRRRGPIRDGALYGDLVLRGGGDPTLAEAPRAEALWRAFGAAVQAAGIQRVRGRVVGDGVSFLGDETLGQGWQWDYLDADYAAPFGGLCVAGNVLEVRITVAGAEASIELLPEVDDRAAWLDAALSVDAAAQRDRLAVHRRLGQQRTEVTGSVAPGGAPRVVRVAVADPERFAAAVATAGLRRAGLAIEGNVGMQPANAVRADDEIVMATVASPPLAELVARSLMASDNLCAEQMFRVAAREHGAGPGSDAAAGHAARMLQAMGVPTDGLAIADGSGLSRRNLVAPAQLAALLLAALRAPWREPFVAGLPVAGSTGTLAQRLRDGPARGHVRAKTGTLARVVCLSGYVDRPQGAPLVFSVMLNDFTCDADLAEAAVDRFVERLAAAAGW